MSDQEILERLVREVEFLKTEVARVQALTPLYLVWNPVTLPQLTASQNDFDVGPYTFVDMTSDAPRTITGIAGGIKGRVLILANVGLVAGNTIILANLSASSLAINRIAIMGAANLTMNYYANGNATFVALRHNGTNWAEMFRSRP